MDMLGKANKPIKIALVLLLAVGVSLVVLFSRSTGDIVNTPISGNELGEGLHVPTFIGRNNSKSKDISMPIKLPDHAPQQYVERCVLDLVLAASHTSVEPTGTVFYELDVKNIGGSLCGLVSISNYYSDNIEFISGTPSPNSSNYYWSIPSLASGDSKRISFSISHRSNKDTGSMELESCAAADGVDDSCKKSSVSIGKNQSNGSVVSSLANTAFDLKGKEYGSWIWESPVETSEKYQNDIFTFAVSQGINTIYVTVDDYLEIYSMIEGDAKEKKKQTYFDSVAAFISRAQAKGISVDAEAGWRDWAEPTVRWKADAIVAFVKEYNSTRSPKFRGLQYDVEPYLLPSYENDKTSRLKYFVELVERTSALLEGTNIRFAIVIPHFYDSAQAWTPSFTYNGTSAHTFTHLLKIMNKRPGGSIILMSYRNTAEGEDGTIQLSEVEVAQATKAGGPTSIIVAQEVGNVEPDYVTFYGTSRKKYIEQAGIVQSVLRKYKNFGGMAVHYIDTLRELPR